MIKVMVLLMVVLLLLAVMGKFQADGAPPNIISLKLMAGKENGPLYVMVHGLGSEADTGWQRWQRIADELRDRGDVALIRYPANPSSNADALAISTLISTKVQHAWESKRYEKVVVVGFSMGALIARRAVLLSRSQVSLAENGKAPVPWAGKLDRVVLLAGMNRGWDLSGEKPADMRWYTHTAFALGSWFAKLSGFGRLLMEMESGSPFVANLRIDWMKHMKDHPGKLRTVQLLGDIDEIVSHEDNQDLIGTGNNDFVWLKVRGSGHQDVINFDEHDENSSVGQYRRNKFNAAISQEFDTLREQAEDLPAATDREVSTIIFVMHGIRDLGRWSSEFEIELQMRHKATGSNGKLAIASIRYGYFGMGQFLLRRDREKYVRWFMDQYTETLARYPYAKEIHFFGHSNGTYLLAKALELYPSLRVDKVVMAGSVVRREYDWLTRFKNGQVKEVRNYVADDDWVVALFPRFFEAAPMRLLNNDVGSAGFNGFDAEGGNGVQVHNIGFIKGQHDAFMGQVQGIAAYLIPADALHPAPRQITKPMREVERSGPVLKVFSDWFTFAIWLPLAFVLIWLGSRVAGAAGNQSLVALVAYIALVFQLLRWV